MDSRFRGNDVGGRLRPNDGVIPFVPFPSCLIHTKAGRAFLPHPGNSERPSPFVLSLKSPFILSLNNHLRSS